MKKIIYFLFTLIFFSNYENGMETPFPIKTEESSDPILASFVLPPAYFPQMKTTERDEKTLPHIQKLVDSCNLPLPIDKSKGYYIGTPSKPEFYYPGDCDPKQLPGYCSLVWRYIAPEPAEPSVISTVVPPPPIALPLAFSSVQQLLTQKPLDTPPENIPDHLSKPIERQTLRIVLPPEEQTKRISAKIEQEAQCTTEEHHSLMGMLEQKKVPAEDPLTKQPTKEYDRTDYSDEECEKLKEQRRLKTNEDAIRKQFQDVISPIKATSVKFVQWPEDRYQELVRKTYKKTELKHKSEARRAAQLMTPTTPSTPGILYSTPSSMLKKSRKK